MFTFNTRGWDSLISRAEPSSSALKLQQSGSDQMTSHDYTLKLALCVFSLTIPPQNEFLRTQDKPLWEFFQNF